MLYLASMAQRFVTVSLCKPKEKVPSRGVAITTQQRIDNWREVQTVVADCAARHESSKELARDINTLAYDPNRFKLLSVEEHRLDTNIPSLRPAKRARADVARTHGNRKMTIVLFIVEAEATP